MKQMVSKYLVKDKKLKLWCCRFGHADSETVGCSYTSKSKSNAVVHMCSHLGIKKFKCDQCGSGFTTKQNLADHIRRHTDDRKYQCPVPGCKWSFFRKRELLAHGKTKLHQSFEFKKFLGLVSQHHPNRIHLTPMKKSQM